MTRAPLLPRARTWAALLACVAIGAACDGQASTARPNVVLVSIDTLRADHLSCYGYPRATSPNLDRLAARGVRFAQAFSASNQTLPSHVAILASAYPQQVEITRADGENTNQGNTKLRLPETATTLAEALARAGYATAAWTGGGLVAPHYGLGQGFDAFEAATRPEEQGFGTSLPAFTAWLQARDDAEQPFFAFLHSYDVHDPYHAPPAFERAFSARTADEFVQQEGFLPTATDLRARWPAPGGEQRQAIVDLYDNGVAAADFALAQLVTILEETGEWEDTLLVVLSDHGEEFHEHGNWGHGPSLFDELLHVPLILRLPGDAHGGEVVDAVVRTVDVAPTILELCDAPGDVAWAGRSLLPLVEGSEVGDRPALAAISNAELGSEALVDGPWKWIARARPGQDLLFNRGADPEETRDLSGAARERGARLGKRLGEWTAELRAESDFLRAVPMDADGRNLQEMEQELLNQMGYVGD